MKARLSKKFVSKTAVLSVLAPFSSLAMAHNEETASSVVATLVHQLSSPDHLLMLAGSLGLATAAVIYGPSLYRRIRQGKR
ncbi:hypothetical protein [Neptunomonas qingdaonensis]|uniref:Uncharacterized protein n=1 Tax=Neptunomonas qingdaonensis TaxID=1045558 RepID=A0A1I2M996_9GAMM|nr:hypothetical protein [Neptunomonas qingdaonensis]SFF88064.1 hypothetical protein SAMN05216175_101500 [Neptunomonas qingdaonensis]